MTSLKSKNYHLPIVAIVGRPNIGKSSLFNCIMHRRIAIVHEQPGVTRDRVSMPAYWHNHHFLLVDTGGLGIMRKAKKGDFFDLEIRNQLEASLENVDIVIVVTDIQEGVTPMDREVVKFMFEKSKKCILVCNKADNPSIVDDIEDFYQLGIKDIVAISCLHRFQIDTLLNKLVSFLPEERELKHHFDLRLSVVGRPNVGKSSLTNALLGENRVIVSDMAGTTRDAIEIPFSYSDNSESRDGILVDTAGMKKSGKVDNLVDMFSMMRTEDSIKLSSIVLFVIEASLGVTSYDKKVASLILKYGKPCLIIVNKWDLVKGKLKKNNFEEKILKELSFMKYAPLVFVSALNLTGLDNILEQIILVNDQASIQVPTALVNHVLQDMVQRTPPPSSGKGFFKIYYGVMTKNPPASFMIFCNRKNYLQKSYLSFMDKQLRRAFSLTGIPIEINLRERSHIQDVHRSGGTIPKDIKGKLKLERKKKRILSKQYRK